MQVLYNFGGGSKRAERFATCPPAYGLLLYLRKALSPLALAKMVACIDTKPPIAATGVVRPPQRSKGGDRAAGGGHERRWARQGRRGFSTKQSSTSLQCQLT
jgi:hypothetical protein